MDANTLIAELGGLIGVPSLALNDRGQCRLTIDGATVVDLEHDAPAGLLHIYSSLGGLAATGREAVMETLLAGNLFGAETAGGTLAYDPAERDVVLCRALPVESLTAADLVPVLEQHVAAVEQWRKRLAAASLDAEPAATAEVPMRPGIRA